MSSQPPVERGGGVTTKKGPPWWRAFSFTAVACSAWRHLMQRTHAVPVRDEPELLHVMRHPFGMSPLEEIALPLAVTAFEPVSSPLEMLPPPPIAM
jgi:hypothetical protein